MAFLSHRFCWKGSSQPCDLIKIKDDMLIDLQVIHRYSVAVFLVNFTGQYTKVVFDLSRITSLLLPLEKNRKKTWKFGYLENLVTWKIGKYGKM